MSAVYVGVSGNEPKSEYPPGSNIFARRHVLGDESQRDAKHAKGVVIQMLAKQSQHL